MGLLELPVSGQLSITVSHAADTLSLAYSKHMFTCRIQSVPKTSITHSQ